MKCNRPLRTGSCQMDAGHRGRCSTVTFFCDGCGQTRRGYPYSAERNPHDGEVEVVFCFMCIRVPA